jgi:hypothetical protein
MDWTWYLFGFDGRINRAKLWLAMVVLLGLMMSVGLAIVAIYSLFGADPLTPPPPRDTRPPWDQQSEIEMVPHKAGPPPVWRVKPGYE